jgi:hypothetical protein
MKKTIVSICMVIAAYGLASYSAGNFTQDVSGLGLGQSCAQTTCHVGIGTSGDNNIVKVIDASGTNIANTAASWIPGSTYTIEVSIPTTNLRAGFQCLGTTFMTDSGVGIVSNTIMPNNINIWNAPVANRVYASHTLAGCTAVIMGGNATWRYVWTAPATNVGAIKFACAVNKSNADLSTAGDSIRIGTAILQQPTSLNFALPLKLALYPNPCISSATIVVAEPNSHYDYRIVDASGKEVLKQSILATNTIAINVDQLPQGNYIVHLQSASGRAYTAQLQKRAQ